MGREVVGALTVALVLQIIAATRPMCPSDPNCICGGTLAIELNCNIDGRTVKINLLPNTYINIECKNATSLDYNKLPKCANHMNTFKSVSFKDCPLPSSSFKDVLSNIGVSKTMALIFQNANNLSGYFDRKHFAGLQNLTKLLLSVNGVTHLPNNLFMDINKLTWLNIRANSINLSEELFKPLEKLETLEISHNHMTNISSNLFSHLSFLRKLSLWQSNLTWFSKDFFTGVDVLEELDLSSNGLNELPASIFKPLKKLKKLTLFSNKFSSFPRNLFKSNNELETVIILNNDVKLKELPKHLFGNLPNLKQVYIQRCGLENIPYDVFSNSPLITNISLAYNEITTLSESIFNDQIYLLELDLSHNKLVKLEAKLFSSLVRLERLNLYNNLIVEISGSTFSSLLSLIYLNMENNNLKTITSYLFSNNKQRMSISLAYNHLDFENKQLENSSWVIKRISPFAHTYNLKLLNLSHNEFKVTFDDWWFNGHDNLDISYNSIQYLWENENSSKIINGRCYQDITKKPLKEIQISNNPLKCVCKNFLFFDFLQENTKTKVVGEDTMLCSTWTKQSCYLRFTLYINIVVILVMGILITVTLFILYRRQIFSFVKNKFYTLFYRANASCSESQKIMLKYSDKDEEFVFKEVLPGLRCHRNFKIHTDSISVSNNKQSFMSNFTSRAKGTFTTLVVFSPNYLTSAYSNVNIKKIRGEMLKAKNTVYVFVDIGPDNSIYAFLKDQRDRRTTIIWREPDFWNTFLGMLSLDDKMKKYESSGQSDSNLNRKYKINDTVTKTSAFDQRVRVYSTPPDCPNLYAFDTFSHSQV